MTVPVLVAANLRHGRVKAQDAENGVTYVCRGCCGVMELCVNQGLCLFVHANDHSRCSPWFADRPFSIQRVRLQNLYAFEHIDVVSTLKNGDFIKTDLVTLKEHAVDIIGKHWVPTLEFVEQRLQHFANSVWILCDTSPIFFGDRFVVCFVSPLLIRLFYDKYAPVFIWLPTGFYRIYLWGTSHVMAQYIANSVMLSHIFGLDANESVNQTLFPEPHCANTNVQMDYIYEMLLRIKLPVPHAILPALEDLGFLWDDHYQGYIR